MSDFNENELFRQLEAETPWDELASETPDAYLLSVDEDRQRLIEAFYRHMDNMSRETNTRYKLQEVAQLLVCDIEALQDLRMDDQLQTRGMGVCIGFDEMGELRALYELSDDVRARGRLISIECLPAPTDFALMTGSFDNAAEYEPALAFMFDKTTMQQPDGDVTSIDGDVVAVIMRPDGVRLDKVIDK